MPDLSPITVLFDLDRTLLHSNGGTRRGMELAGRAVWGGGFTLEGVQRGGRLDEHILQDGCRELGPGWRDLFFSGLQRFLELYEQVLPGELKCTTALPGARAAVSALATRRDRVLGVVTGNVAAAGRLKLAAAGIDLDQLPAQGFSDGAQDRAQIVGRALQRGAAVAGYALDPARVAVVGDTPHDMAAARARGCLSVGVTTGDYAADALAAAQADAVLDSLHDLPCLIERWEHDRESMRGRTAATCNDSMKGGL